jgi:hypothetical protein
MRIGSVTRYREELAAEAADTFRYADQRFLSTLLDGRSESFGLPSELNWLTDSGSVIARARAARAESCPYDDQQRDILSWLHVHYIISRDNKSRCAGRAGKVDCGPYAGSAASCPNDSCRESYGRPGERKSSNSRQYKDDLMNLETRVGLYRYDYVRRHRFNRRSAGCELYLELYDRVAAFGSFDCAAQWSYRCGAQPGAERDVQPSHELRDARIAGNQLCCYRSWYDSRGGYGRLLGRGSHLHFVGRPRRQHRLHRHHHHGSPFSERSSVSSQLCVDV